MRRRVQAILASLSLVLCLATAVLWTLSYFWYAGLGNVPWSYIQTPWQRHYAVYFHAGIVELSTWQIAPRPQPGATNQPWHLNVWRASRVMNELRNEFLLGVVKFRWTTGTTRLASGNSAEQHLWFSCIFPTLLFAIAPLLWLRKLVGARAAMNAGQCQRCGYDLRATPARCPECGAIPASSVNALASQGAT